MICTTDIRYCTKDALNYNNIGSLVSKKLILEWQLTLEPYNISLKELEIIPLSRSWPIQEEACLPIKH